MELPNDLIPLSTQPWEIRPDSIPLNVEECRTAVWLSRGNITTAANRLKVSPARLRRFVSNSPRLSAEVNEARQQLADIAEDVVYIALTSDDPARQDSMARYVLSSVGRERGYGNKTGAVTINNNGGGVVQIGWADGTSFGDKDDVEEANIIDAEAAE